MSPDGRFLVAISHDNKGIYLRGNMSGVWKNCATMDFLEEPVWSPDSTWLQFIGRKEAAGERALYRISALTGKSRQILDLSRYRFVGTTWVGVGPDGSPLGLLGRSEELFALDWALRRALPLIQWVRHSVSVSAFRHVSSVLGKPQGIPNAMCLVSIVNGKAELMKTRFGGTEVW
jgi:hypothetical protein